jgi:hypothetical protein
MTSTARRLLLLTLLVGCASGSVPRRPGSEAAAEVEAIEQQLAKDVAALEAPSAEGRPLDCGRARTLRDNICTLAERICTLVERDRSIADGVDRCQRARQRCKDARARVSVPCGG